jgi:hypothetical protein
MGELDVRLAILSISSPGVHFGEAAAAVELARAVNEAGAHIVRAKPGRFGFFAALPLPELDAAVVETRYALDKLGANGICPFTNHDGMYLGDERLEPIYAEVEARKSVVFVHPTSPPQPAEGLGFAAPMLEFIFETTRSITDLVLTGVLVRHPELRIIVPHAGAALPIVAGRVDMLAWILANLPEGAEVVNLRSALKSLHFDLAEPRWRSSSRHCCPWPTRRSCITAATFRSRHRKDAKSSCSSWKPPGTSTTRPAMPTSSTTPTTCSALRTHLHGRNRDEQFTRAVTHQLARDLTTSVKTYGHFINGEWVEWSCGETIDLWNPATGALLARTQSGDAADIDRAVNAAHDAFPAGRPARRSIVRSCCARSPNASSRATSTTR